MRALLPLFATCLTTYASAQHFCAEMLEADNLDANYSRIAPLYNSEETGWIFGTNQLRGGYALDPEVQGLLVQIKDEIAAYGTELLMLIPPPRPVVAGTDVLRETAGGEVYDVEAMREDFGIMIAQLNALGIPAPDLLDVAGDGYYFLRDTHWTNLGAAQSAVALAETLGLEPGFDPLNLPVSEIASEPGSLAEVAALVCDRDMPDEKTPVFNYAALSQMDLLGDFDRPLAALLGSSFSDRYRRDSYQTADALSTALNMDVANHSVSGGGLVGPLEAYISMGTLVAERPAYLIWEFPYSNHITPARARQILGALRADTALPVQQIPLVDDSVTVHPAISPNLLGIGIEDPSILEVKVRVRFADGGGESLTLRRKARVVEMAALESWWVDLSGLPEISSLKLEIEGTDQISLWLK